MINEILAGEVNRARRYEHFLSVMMVDIDNFKLFNDTLGHMTGDRVLQRIARVLMTTCRSTDQIGRYGGDEFLIVMPETDFKEAEFLAQRVLQAVDKEKVVVGESQFLPISCSIGIATFPNIALTQQELIEKADAGMYQIKRSGGRGVGMINGDVPPHLTSDNSWSVLDGLVAAVDNKDRYTREHSQTVTQYAISLARELGFRGEMLERLRTAALLHDVGKLGVPDRILRKPGPLTPDENLIIQQHPSFGVLLVNPVSLPQEVLSAIKYHHERYDGTGYPDGLEGETIPVLARILAVADSFSAMTTDRPYRKGMLWEKAIKELQEHAGTQFDPVVTEAFCRILADELMTARIG